MVIGMLHPSQGTTRPITTVAEYEGQPVVRLSATQLGSRYTPYQAKKVVDEWCLFFAAGPSPMVDLSFTSRTPRRLFESLAAQTQLRVLAVTWGDYEDLSVLRGMGDLEQLWLDGASSVRSIEPLGQLGRLRVLRIESLRHVHDLSALGHLTGLRDLTVGGDWRTSRQAHVDSLGFLRKLRELQRLVLHTLLVEDLDYSPLLELRYLTEARVMAVRGMRPSHHELRAAIAALAAAE